MAALTDLISKVQDTELRRKLMEEAKRLNKQKKFGLVFEDYIPECTPLWDIPVKRGSLVARKGGIQETFVVQRIHEGFASCYSEVSKTTEEIPLDEQIKSGIHMTVAMYLYVTAVNLRRMRSMGLPE